MRDLLWRVCFRRKIWPHQVTGDAKYGTTENIVAIEDAGIRAYVPLTDFEHRIGLLRSRRVHLRRRAGPVSLPARPPAAARARRKQTEGVVVYRGDPATCNACPVKAACTTSDRGRTSSARSTRPTWRRCAATTRPRPYKKAMRKRQVWVEPLFAEAKEWHGLRRLRLRGLMNANIQGLLIAAGQNLKRFLAATGWGRRHAPCGSLLALPGSRRLSAVSG